MFRRIIFWLGNSRLFSLPMTFMSWLIIFVYSIEKGGNVLNGILALIGIAMAHLATNLFDDYIDYKDMVKETVVLQKSHKNKCKYLLLGEATSEELLKVIIIYCLIAFVTGVWLTYECGLNVILLAIIGGAITLLYPKLSSNGYSELAVGIAFGPLLFEGVYYVMCHCFSFEVFLLSLAIVAFTIGLVYMNNLLDYDEDIASGKKSMCINLGSKSAAAIGILIIYLIGYIACIILALYTKHYLYMIPIITFPLAYNIYNSIKLYYKDKTFVPKVRWWNYPLDNWNNIQNSGYAGFYLRIYLARNIMMWVSVLMLICVIAK